MTVLALRGKKPEIKPQRFKALIFGREGSGKSHFVCDIPDAYIIDTEGLSQYKKFVKKIHATNSVVAEIKELEDIIKEVKTLSSTKHSYKTVIIDSASPPYNWLCNLEAERLKRDGTEGVEFGKNTAKPKRLMMHLGLMLERLDMNVIVTSHETGWYIENVEVGKKSDVPDKIAHLLGASLHIEKLGTTDVRKLRVRKSRYDELPDNKYIDFNGYETIKELFGENIFLTESVPQELANQEQLTELKYLLGVLNVSEETIQKHLLKSKSTAFSELPKEYATVWINGLKNIVNQQQLREAA